MRGTFHSKGKVVTSSGWKEVYENQLHEDDEDEIAESALKDQTLPCLSKGETYPIQNVSVTSGKTKPPAPFNEATLLSAMENPVKYMESRDAKAARTPRRQEGSAQ